MVRLEAWQIHPSERTPTSEGRNEVSTPKAFSFKPMLCQRTARPPEGPQWRYELKLDGYRAIARKSGRSTQLWSRNQKDFARRFQAVAKAIAYLPEDTAIDGEVVALDHSGRPSFELLQGLGGPAPLIVFYAFDLLMFRGKDVRPWCLEERRGQLGDMVAQLPDTVRYSDTFNVPLADLVLEVRKRKLEGIVAKRARSPYRSGERCGDWLKWRANRGQEFVIGGYVANGEALDSILVGYFKDAKLMYAGRIRAGIPTALRRVLLPHFEELRVARCPFRNLPDRTEGRWGEGLTAARMGSCRWLEPFIVARIEFLEWTPEGRLRHPRFAGIRSNKDARDVVRE